MSSLSILIIISWFILAGYSSKDYFNKTLTTSSILKEKVEEQEHQNDHTSSKIYKLNEEVTVKSEKRNILL